MPQPTTAPKSQQTIPATPTRPRETNVEFVTRLMEFSRSGAMAQLVILTALDNYVGACLADEAATLKQFDGSFVNGHAWLAACREIAAEIKTRHT